MQCYCRRLIKGSRYHSSQVIFSIAKIQGENSKPGQIPVPSYSASDILRVVYLHLGVKYNHLSLHGDFQLKT